MSLKEDERRVLVTLELEKVDKTLEEMEAKIQPTRLLIDKIKQYIAAKQGQASHTIGFIYLMVYRLYGQSRCQYVLNLKKIHHEREYLYCYQKKMLMYI